MNQAPVASMGMEEEAAERDVVSKGEGEEWVWSTVFESKGNASIEYGRCRKRQRRPSEKR